MKTDRRYKGFKIWLDRDGYERVTYPEFERDGVIYEKKNRGVHQLVYIYNVGPIPAGYHIHHKDGNKRNNSLENLEILTAEEHGRVTHTGRECLHSRKRVYCAQTKRVYGSIREAAKETGVGNSHITLVCKGHCTTAKGYTFEYIH